MLFRTNSRAKRLASVETRAPPRPPAERRCRRGHDVLHGARAAPPPLRHPLRADEERRRRALGGVRGGRARGLGAGWVRRLALRRQAGRPGRRRLHRRSQPRLRACDQCVGARRGAARAGLRQRVLVGWRAGLAGRLCAARTARCADRDRDGRGRLRRAARPGARRARDGRRRTACVPRSQRARLRALRAPRCHARRSGGASAAIGSPPDRRVAARGDLAGRPPRPPVRRPDGARPAQAARARLGRRRDRRALLRDCRARDGLEPAARAPERRPRAAVPAPLRARRLDRDLDRTRLGRHERARRRAHGRGRV